MTETTLDHKKLIASLSDEERLDLTARSNAQGLLMLASHLSALLVTGLWIFFRLPAWQLIMLFHGIQIVFLFTLLHETVHDTPFQSIALNRIVGWFCSLLIVLPPTWFRYFHLAHHRYTHDPERDPELRGKPDPSLKSFLWNISGLPVWWFHLKTLFINAFGTFEYDYLPQSANGRVRREARLMVAFYATVVFVCIYLSSTVLLHVWIIPALIGQPFLRLYLMAEHGRCPHVANMLENSRTTYTTAVVRWLAWNMPYHAEHHAYPSVPFHKLAKFHAVTRAHIGSLENGYVAFHRKNIEVLRNAK